MSCPLNLPGLRRFHGEKANFEQTARRRKKRNYARAIIIIVLFRKRAMSFQIMVLKILAGHPKPHPEFTFKVHLAASHLLRS
jgi:hypothetical protein